MSSSSVETYRNDKYTITTSLDDERSIYIKIVNNISYMCYEGNFDIASFKLPFELDAIYELVNKCFAEFGCPDSEEDDEEEDEEMISKKSNNQKQKYRMTVDTYELKINVENSMMRLGFCCLVGGFLNIDFDLYLREKLMANDAQLSLNFQKVEQNQTKVLERIDTVASQMVEFAKKMKEMERRLEALGHADICFLKPPTNDCQHLYSFPIDSKKIEVNSDRNSITAESFLKIKYLYQLEDLCIKRCDWVSASNISSSTVKKLAIYNSNQFNEISFIKNFPELEELKMVQGSIDGSIVTTLRSIKHKIKKLTFQSMISGINQTEMQTYCTQNNIVLNLS